MPGYRPFMNKQALSEGIDNRDELLESMSEQEHDSWARWMDYLFSQSTENNDGSVTIPSHLVAKWRRKSTTPYHKLSEEEKESDRTEADKFIGIIEEHE